MKDSFARKFGSRATKLTLGFAVVTSRKATEIAKDVAAGASEAASEYRATKKATRKPAKK